MARSRGQSAPIIPHLSRLKPSPETDATRILYDRLNDIETRTRETVEAQQRIIDQQADDLRYLESFVRANKVATDAFFASQGFATQVGNEAGVPPPPPEEPPGGGGGGPPVPPPGAAPFPDHRVYVMETAEQFKQLLKAAAGNPTPDRRWITKLMQKLRSIDTRWGYRMNPHVTPVLSHDKIAYYYGLVTVPRERSLDTYCVDVIGQLGDPGGNVPHYDMDPTATGKGIWTGNGEF